MKNLRALMIAGGCVLAFTAAAQDTNFVGFGPKPSLPKPQQGLLPTLNVADASLWKAGEAPTPAAGLAVARFAEGLDHPRWLYVLPNGDVVEGTLDDQGKAKIEHTDPGQCQVTFPGLADAEKA